MLKSKYLLDLIGAKVVLFRLKDKKSKKRFKAQNPLYKLF